MTSARQSRAPLPPATTWSIGAGLSLFLCATAVAYALSDLLALLGDVIGLPAGFAMVILASPSLAIGALLWWTVVERRAAFAYRFGAGVGLLTAALTGLLWVLRFVDVWGFEMLAVDVVAVLAAVVLGVAVTVGAIIGLPLMYARRRLGPAGSD